MKTFKFQGVEFNIVDQADIDRAASVDETHHYIVIRVADADPSAYSPALNRRRLRTLCEDCREVCFIDPLSFESLRGVKLRIVCAQCQVVHQRTEKFRELFRTPDE